METQTINTSTETFPRWVRFVLSVGAFYAVILLLVFLGSKNLIPDLVGKVLHGAVFSAIIPFSGVVFVFMLFLLSFKDEAGSLDKKQLFLKGLAKKFFVLWGSLYLGAILLSLLVVFVSSGSLKMLLDSFILLVAFPITAVLVPYGLSVLALLAQISSYNSSETKKPSVTLIVLLVILVTASFVLFIS